MFYVDKNIINNSSLACFLFVFFTEEYEKLSIDDRFPDLMQFLLILPFTWNKISREAIKTKKSSTPLDVVIQATPIIKSNINQRIADYSGITLQGLNFAVSSGLLIKVEADNKILFKRSPAKWPTDIKKTLPSDMSKTIIRLANWFYHMDTPLIYSLLLGKSS
ncbi:DUF6521 family protein [Escherichia albertii]|uniref:three component ABC system middle component n=1 Tax=Escherichia albertii TaxID=208962 RepID=UPI000743BBE6|nr:three component ABC system middle component [Escherichia albertii]MCZ9157778.1 DUF6521 family protein [Escherichia albertii]MDN4001514.1 DUF6521 family protein [Escherichia albertii]WDC34110.1 DUF6521 family protein [Escherichia albertii]